MENFNIDNKTKIPCIKCTKDTWEYIRPFLIRWGYINAPSFNNKYYDLYPLLIINFGGKFGIYNLDGETVACDYNRVLINDVDEFLELAAELKGFNKRNNIIEINGIEIKPGMVFRTDKHTGYDLYVVIPLLHDELGVVRYSGGYWNTLSNFIATYQDDIISIRDLSDCSETLMSLGGKVLWEKPKKIIITIEEISKKFNIPVEQIEIK